jgi:hypothetical protein
MRTILLVFLLSITFYSQAQNSFNSISINQFLISLDNAGNYCLTDLQGNGGCLWPGGNNAYQRIIFGGGLTWGGMANGTLTASGNMIKRKINIITVLATLLFAAPESYPQNYEYSYNYISINQFKVWLSNNGKIASTPNRGGGGLWPGGGNAYKNFFGWNSIFWGGKVNDSVVIYQYGTNTTFAPGKIFDNGEPDNPNQEKYRVYKIRKNWETIPFGNERDQFEKDYNEWPVDDGAPWIDIDGDGIYTRGVDQPDYVGDEVLWYVANDTENQRRAENGFPPSFTNPPLKIEIQTTLWGYNRSGTLGDVIFIKYKYINKNSITIDSMFLSFDHAFYIGGPYLRMRGIDTTINLIYTYRNDNQSLQYDIPPAGGDLLLQGPIVPSDLNDSAKFNGEWKTGYKNLNFYAHFPDIKYDSTTWNFSGISTKDMFWNRMKGLHLNGQPIIDLISEDTTRYMFSGNPIENSGWIEPNGYSPGINISGGFPFAANSLNHYTSIGPFTLAPFDTQEVVIATIAAQGTDHLNSLEELFKRAKIIKRAYELNFQLTPLPPQPASKAFEQEGSVMLWWDRNAESYNEEDPFILEQGYEDTTYTFEGYRIWQYRDSLGRDPRAIAIYDETNGVTVIEDNIIANGISVKAPVIYGNDGGLRRYVLIDEDVYSRSRLYNGNEYYFGVTAYAYSPNSSPSYLESEPNIIKVIPGRPKIDYNSPYKSGSVQQAVQINGTANAEVLFKVIDPSALTGEEYEVYFESENDTLKYGLINLARMDTLFRSSTDFSADTIGKIITDGFIVLINDIDGRSIDSLSPANRPYGIKRVLEVKGAGGVEHSEPKNVFENLSSTGNWQLKAGGTASFREQNYDIFHRVGVDDYEIRFTPSGSEYYTTGYGTGNVLFNNDPKGKGRVPFEIWNITKGERLHVKILDRVETDTMWNRDNNSGDWERIYGITSSEPYAEPLPEMSGISSADNFKLGNIILNGEVPEEGTVIRIETFKPIQEGYTYRAVMEKANFTDKSAGIENMEKITVFPNPYLGGNNLEGLKKE